MNSPRDSRRPMDDVDTWRFEMFDLGDFVTDI